MAGKTCRTFTNPPSIGSA